MRKSVEFFLVVVVLTVFCLPVSAEKSEWKDRCYQFAKVKTVVVTETKFSYDGFDVSGKNRFEDYPNSTEKIADMLSSSLKKVPNVLYVTLQYVADQVRAEPDFPGYEPGSREFMNYVRLQMPKYADVVLYVEIRDFGWFYEYRPSYYTTETVVERVEYGGKTPDGKTYSGWRDVPQSKVVYHAAHHEIFDSAEAAFNLVDVQTGKSVWKYSDTRTRPSISFGRSYDHSGPESMMRRIMDDFTGKLPFGVKEARALEG